MAKIKVGVKFCGNCNPCVDGPAIIGAAGIIADNIEFVSWACAEKDLLLIFSGCTVDCVNKPAFEGPVVNVVCTCLDGRPWTERELPGELIRAITSRLQSGCSCKRMIHASCGDKERT